MTVYAALMTKEQQATEGETTPENKEKKMREKKTVSWEGLNPVLSARDQQLLAAHTWMEYGLKHLFTATATDCKSLHRPFAWKEQQERKFTVRVPFLGHSDRDFAGLR